MLSSSRQLLYRWVGWFFLANVAFSLLVFMNYLKVLPPFYAISGITAGGVVLGWVFMVLAFVVQISLFCFLGALPVLLLATVYPKRWLVQLAGIFFAGLLTFLIFVESVIYNLYHLHYALVGWHLFKAGAASQVILLSTTEHALIIGLLAVAFLLEYGLAHLVWRRLTRSTERKHHGYKFASVILGSLVLSYGLMFTATSLANKHWLTPSENDAILKAARVAPYFNEFYELVMPGDSAVRQLSTPSGTLPLQVRSVDESLHYPLHPLQCRLPKAPLNVLFIVIDTWRYDAMNKAVTPNIYHFSKGATQYQNHWSGGNCTKPGIFSLFYGLPANYWDAFLSQHRSPVLMQQLQKSGYRMAIYASAPLTFPAFDQTVFSHTKPLTLSTPGDSSVVRDQAITQKFKQFVAERDQQKSTKPFFGFLFYDAVHNYCETTTPEKKPFQPAVKTCDRMSLSSSSDPTPYINRYRNAAYFVDDQVGQVLAALKRHHLDENTVVILTADHGEQLNDERMGYWDHASAYTPYQLHIPMLVYWPGHSPAKQSHFTTHYDVAPTILSHVLGCANSFSDYTVGTLLSSHSARPYLLASSYADYAVVTRHAVTRVYPGGDYVLNSPTGHLLPGATLDIPQMLSAYAVLNRYFMPAPDSKLSLLRSDAKASS